MIVQVSEITEFYVYIRTCMCVDFTTLLNADRLPLVEYKRKQWRL